MLGRDWMGWVSNSSVAMNFPRWQWFCTEKKMVKGLTNSRSLPASYGRELNGLIGLFNPLDSVLRGFGISHSSPDSQHTNPTRGCFSRASPAVCRTKPNSLVAGDLTPGFKASLTMHLHFSV